MEDGIRAKLLKAKAVSKEEAVTIQEAHLDMQEQNWLDYVAGGLFSEVKKTRDRRYYITVSHAIDYEPKQVEQTEKRLVVPYFLRSREKARGTSLKRGWCCRKPCSPALLCISDKAELYGCRSKSCQDTLVRIERTDF